MEVSPKSWFACLLLAACASCVSTASLHGSFRQLDVNFDHVKTPLLDAATSHPGQGPSKINLFPCSAPTAALQPTTSTVHATFTSTMVRLVKRAVVSTETVIGSTVTATETVTVSATPTSEVPQSTAVFSPSGPSTLNVSVLAVESIESNEVNSTSSVNGTSSATDGEVKKTIGERLTGIVRRVVTLTMGILLTPIAAVAQHLN